MEETVGNESTGRCSTAQLPRRREEVTKHGRRRASLLTTRSLSLFRHDNRANIIDPMEKRPCECHVSVPTTPRPSSLVPFHRRLRATPPLVTNDRSRSDHPPEHPNPTAHHRSSPVPHPSIGTQDRSNDWTAVSTPNSVSNTGPSSVQPSTMHVNSVSSTASVSNLPVVTQGTKRSATEAFDGWMTDDDEQEEQKQTYDFSPTDSL